VQFDAATQRIWALCDNTCGVSSTVLKVDGTGTIVPQVVYSRPVGLPNDNLEGFALAPASTCTGGTREALWSDDGVYGAGPSSPTEGHALYSGRIACDLQLGGQGVSGPATDPVAAVSLSAGSGAVGDRITVTGTHFAPGTQVTFVFNSTPVTLGTATAASDGTLTFAFSVPAVPAGAHTVTAAIGGTVVASAAFSVTAAGATVSGGDPAALASTGSDVSSAAGLIALALLIGGGLLILLRRRARTHTSGE
jgi:LPXTG-motif cell wall-anchored protein